MEDPSPLVDGSELITDHFGYWPSFHDGEIEEVRFCTASEHGPGPHIEVVVHAFEMTSEVGADGAYVLKKHCRMTFRFDGVRQVTFGGFDCQNSLSGFFIDDIRSRQLEGLIAEVEFDGHDEAQIQFTCGAISVVELTPTGGMGHHPSGAGRWSPPMPTLGEEGSR